MKNPITFLIPLVAVMLLLASCTKDQSPVKPGIPRTVKFVLHTEKDFSDNNSNITFSLSIRDRDVILFDTTLAAMKIKDIPKGTNPLTFIKTLPAYNATLTAGFRYEIENVGYSWYTDTISAGNQYKVVDYSFK